METGRKNVPINTNNFEILALNLILMDIFKIIRMYVFDIITTSHLPNIKKHLKKYIRLSKCLY